nr:ORF35 [Bracoviriform inaniti]
MALQLPNCLLNTYTLLCPMWHLSPREVIENLPDNDPITSIELLKFLSEEMKNVCYLRIIPLFA